MKILRILDPNGTTMVRAADVIRLRRYDAEGDIVSTLDVLDALIDDRTPHIDRYFDGKFAGLPPTMRTQLELWFDIMIHHPLDRYRRPRWALRRTQRTRNPRDRYPGVPSRLAMMQRGSARAAEQLNSELLGGLDEFLDDFG